MYAILVLDAMKSDHSRAKICLLTGNLVHVGNHKKQTLRRGECGSTTTSCNRTWGHCRYGAPHGFRKECQAVAKCQRRVVCIGISKSAQTQVARSTEITTD